MEKKTIILGLIITAGLLFGIHVYASTGLQVVNSVEVKYGTVYKIYDSDNKVVCYAIEGGSSGFGISCLRN